MSKKKKTCSDCEDCLYIGDGDYVCTKTQPARHVLSDFGTPEEYYIWCKTGAE